MKKSISCILMFSGGLDSTIAAHLLLQQGIDVTALHFVLPFQSGLACDHVTVKKYAEALGVRLRIEEEGEEFLDMVNNPHFGYGKNANPCVDCRIYRLQKAAKIMDDTGAKFIATGEVLGQRPMSQLRDKMLAIEKRSGLKGYLLRPLSAKLLVPTIPENEGWVDRERLLSIQGRGRKEQIAYAKKFGLKHSAPAGGCLLTQKEMAVRFMELRSVNPQFTLNDFKLLAYGRHFRISANTKLVVGRDEKENNILERFSSVSNTRMQMADTKGPLGIILGAADVEQLNNCASILCRYSRLRNNDSARVEVCNDGEKIIMETVPADDEFCMRFRIA